jgi:Starch-binding associating with outer membrane
MKIKSFILIALLAFIGSACKKDFLNINTNPNTLPTATPNYVFTAGLNKTANNMVSSNETGSFWSGQWTQSNSYITVTTLFAYLFTENDFNYWDGYYDNLIDFQFVIENAEANNQKFLKGPAKIMKALLFHQLVDMYGNLPYTDALKGIKSLAPKFDEQKAVYESLITLLDEGIADSKANAFASAFTESDIVFKGNTAKWAKFGNSLKLRILMHQARVASRDTYIKTEINKITTEGSGFITGEDIGSGGVGFYQPTTGKLNPFYARFGYTATGTRNANNDFPRLTQFLVNSLRTAKDTFRLKRYGYAPGNEGATPGVSGKSEIAANYVGIPFGSPSGFVASVSSAIGPSLIIKGQFNKPYILMTAAEIQLNLAEAKERYGAGVNLPNDAKTYFEAGMTESFRTLGAGVANAAKYVGSGIQDYDYVASTNKLKAIATQKWLALCNYSGLEAWTEYRKTGIPNIPQSLQLVDSKRPVRFFYPNTELGSNGEQVNAQGAVDVFSSRLFWDVD